MHTNDKRTEQKHWLFHCPRYRQSLVKSKSSPFFFSECEITLPMNYIHVYYLKKKTSNCIWLKKKEFNNLLYIILYLHFNKSIWTIVLCMKFKNRNIEQIYLWTFHKDKQTWRINTEFIDFKETWPFKLIIKL